jgi:uncharacterized protein YbjT (DUF2867 family)
MIVVTGSAGRVGELLARRLHQLDQRTRLLVRDPAEIITAVADEMPLAAARRG